MWEPKTPPESETSDTEEGRDYLYFSIGHFNTFGDADDEAVDVRAEYRPASSVFIENLKPWVGLEITSDSTLWAGGGLLYEWNFTPDWYLTPSAGLGFYAEGSSELDLDYPVQFRTQIEVSYQFDNQSRVGMGLSHMSNLDLGDTNRGAETLGLSVAFPF